MPQFSTKSEQRLATCHADLQMLFHEVIKYFDCTVSEGFRNQVDQDKAFSEGKSEKKWPNGKHNKNPSMAVDVYPCPVELATKDKREQEIYKIKMAYFAGEVKAISRYLKQMGKISHTVIWGCDWDDDNDLKEHTFFDFPHFELI